MFKKYFALPFLMLVLVAGLAACNDDEDQEENNDNEDTTSEIAPDEVVATVNDEEILAEEWLMLSDSIAQQQMMQLQQAGINPESEEGKEYVEQIEKGAEDQALEQLIQQEAILQKAKTADFTVDSEDIDAKYEETKGQFETEEAFETALENNSLTKESYKESIEEQLLTQNYLDENMDSVEVSNEDVQKAYDEYKTRQENQGGDVQAFEDVEQQIRESLKSEEENKQIQKIIQSVMDETDVERLI